MKITMVLATILIIMSVLISGCSSSGTTTTSTSTSQTTSTSIATTTSTDLTSTTTTPASGTTATDTAPVSRTGSVQMWVTDAPRNDNISEIWVTVSEVKIHEAEVGQAEDDGTGATEGQIDETSESGGWLPIEITGPNRFDLLTLRGEEGGIQQILATTDLAVGRYTQIRMTVEKVEVTMDGVSKNATLPSGSLKFVRSFEVQADSVTKLLFDFDADKFINVSGSPKNPQILAKPVVKLTVSRPQQQQAAGSALKITTPDLPDAEVGVPYNATLAATGGTLPYTWSIASGNLSDGLTLGPDGVITGTPLAGQDGDYTFTIEVSDNSTPVQNDSKEFAITITDEVALSITTTTLDDGIEGIAYSVQLEAIGGELPYSWNVTLGSLPDGLDLDAVTGIISGIPTSTGDFSFTVEVSDNATTPDIDTRELAILITAN